MYNSSTALEASKRGVLLAWVNDYLSSKYGNKELAVILKKQKPTIAILKLFPLHQLKRIAGPERDMLFPEAVAIWEEKVSSLVEKIEKGITLPPLIVTDFWQEKELADGNHRHEALIRGGYKKYWTIFIYKNKQSM